MKILNNEKGNITLMGILFLFLSSTLMAFHFLREHNAYVELAQDLKEQLCLKSMVKDKVTFIERMEMINLSLKAAFTSQMVTVAIPGLQVFTASAEQIKKILKATQQTLFISEMKKTYERYQKGCPFSFSALKTPYKHKVLLTRKLSGEAILRARRWEEIWKGKRSIYKINYQIKGVEVKAKSSRLRL